MRTYIRFRTCHVDGTSSTCLNFVFHRTSSEDRTLWPCSFFTYCIPILLPVFFSVIPAAFFLTHLILCSSTSLGRHLNKTSNFNCCPSVHVDNHTIITPTKCTLLLLKAPDITICTLCHYILPLHVSVRVDHLQGAQCQCLAKVIINYNLLKLC
jgi:hypothetical protein